MTDPDDAAATPGPMRALDPRAITLWRLTTLGRAAILTAAAVAAEVLIEHPLPTGLATGVVVAAGLAAAIVVPPIRYDRWRFALRDEHVHLRYGILFRTTSIVPYARVQHVDTRHGPVDRWLGLAALVLFTAGTRGAIITIPALAADEAEALRDRLAALSGAGDAV